MDKWYENRLTVYKYIEIEYEDLMGEPINDSLKNYLENLGIDELDLKSFVLKFKLEEYLFRDFFIFVVSEENKEKIISYYTQVLYSKTNKREYTYNDDYDYKPKRKSKKKTINVVKGF